MIGKQKEFVEIIDEIINAFNMPFVELPVEKLEAVRQSIQQQELLIPVVGDFSAGKSSLINSFLGSEKILPTDVRPETSLAAELRFDSNERIEAVSGDNLVKTYGLNEFDEIKAHAADYSYIKVYLNNENVRSIEPLVLVDMPGFESPVEQHNKAINEYLSRGAHFIVLVNAQDGTLRRSAFRRLTDIMECDRDFSVVISKSNLVSPDNLQKVTDNISEQINMELDVQKIPVSVGKDGVEAFSKIIESLNPDSLFMRITKPILKNTIYEAKSSVNIKLAALEHSGEQNTAVIDKLKDGLSKIQAREERLLKETQSQEYIESRVQVIISKLGQNLSNSVDSLTNIAAKQGPDAVSKEISDIIQSTLLPLVKSSVNDMAMSIDEKLNIELKDVNSALAAYSLDENFVSNASVGIKNFLENSMTSLNAVVAKRQKKEGGSNLYNIVTGVLAITTNFINPVAELAIVFLPQIIDFFTKVAQKHQQEEAELQRINNIRSQILTQVIPGVKRDLQPNVKKILNDEAQSLVSQITKEYEAILESKQNEIDAAEKERQINIDEMNKKIESLKTAKSIVENAYSTVCQIS
nr:dynamin family protein [Treponema sp.]